LHRYPESVAWARRARYLIFSALAAVWAAALGAAQLLPGLSFITASQRGTETYAFFGTGSLHPQWTILLLVPDLFGGNGVFGQPGFFNSYNLPEVTGYVGLIPLVAAFALAPSLFGRRRSSHASDHLPWFVLAVVGLILTWGSFTWLGPLIWHIPFFGSTRLQSRNIGIVDLAICVLFGFWIDRALSSEPRSAGLQGRRRWISAAPVIGAAVVCVVAIAIPNGFYQALTVGSGGPFGNEGRAMTPWLIGQLVIVLGALCVIFAWERLSRAHWQRLLLLVVVADVGLFSVATQTSFLASGLTIDPSAQLSASVLGTTGRYAIYDPVDQNLFQLTKVGQADTNVLTRMPSVQGYGSIVSGNYGTETGTHPRDLLDPCALQRGVFTQLRLHTLLTESAYLAPQVRQPLPAESSNEPCPGAPLPGTARQRTWYFGQSLAVQSVSLVTAGRDRHPGPLPAVGLLGPTGVTSWPKESVLREPTGWQVRFTGSTDSTGIVVRGAVRHITDQSLVDAQGTLYVLDGSMQDAVGRSGWYQRGFWNGFVAFSEQRVLPPVWIQHPGSGARVSQVSTTDWGVETDRVSSPVPITVVRSEAYLGGWHVQAVSATGGQTRTLSVVPDGLVQAVRVPAGTWTLMFLYRAKGLSPGFISSGIAVALFGVFAVVSIVRRRRSTMRPSSTVTGAR
jgi:hypothetical protein